MKVLFRQNLSIILVLAAWFTTGTFLFYFLHGNNLVRALEYAFWLGVPDEPSPFSNGYGKFGIVILIPVTLKVLINNLQTKFSPELGCRLMARETQNHTVVIGYTHLGIRLVDLFLSREIPYTLIEEDPSLVRDLLSRGEPVVVGDPREVETLKDAGVPRAEVVIVATDDLSRIFLVSKRVRDMNERCLLIVRCFQEELTEVLESLGVNMVISSSKSAADEILRHLREREMERLPVTENTE
ncbi:MAG: potassium channel family protein [Candidatus Bathyarchaeia archaeon]